MKHISVRTASNGYELTVGSRSYFVFSPESLVEAVFYHIGLNNKDYASPDDMKGILEACKEWTHSKSVMTDNATLRSEIATLKRENQALRLKSAHNSGTISNLKKRIKELETRVRNQPVLPLGHHPDVLDIIDPQGKPIINKSVDYSPELWRKLTTPIVELDLPGRVKSTLMTVGLTQNITLGDALRYPRSEFEARRGAGRRVMAILDSWLQENHLNYEMDIESIIWKHDHRHE